MKKLRSQARKINLLFALELLDEMVRQSPIEYVGTTTEQAVAEAIRRARKRSAPREVPVHKDQLLLLAVTGKAARCDTITPFCDHGNLENPCSAAY